MDKLKRFLIILFVLFCSVLMNIRFYIIINFEWKTPPVIKIIYCFVLTSDIVDIEIENKYVIYPNIWIITWIKLVIKFEWIHFLYALWKCVVSFCYFIYDIWNNFLFKFRLIWDFKRSISLKRDNPTNKLILDKSYFHKFIDDNELWRSVWTSCLRTHVNELRLNLKISNYNNRHTITSI